MPRLPMPRLPLRLAPARPFAAALLLVGLAGCQSAPPPAPPSVPPPTLDSHALAIAPPASSAVAAAGDAHAAGQPASAAAVTAVIERHAAAARAKQLSRPSAAERASAAAPALAPMTAMYVPSAMDADREHYAHREPNGTQRAAEQPVSTFSVDVDTASYANVRRFLEAGQLPPVDAVRVEELINAFDYADAPPAGQRPEPPFAVHTELAPAPWDARKLLLRIGLKGWLPERLPASNLVFLVDVSGSMQSPDKLPLLKSALKLLVARLRPEDRVSLVTYAGHTELMLAATPGSERATILGAIDRLGAGGSTNGGAGIRLAYEAARSALIRDGVNRILLCTDGDFNVGTTDFEQLKNLVERERASGVALSTLGFGTGNYDDALMEQLADAGDGNYSYIDSLAEAEKVLVRNRAGTLGTIAKDVKVQVEFNPAAVAEYRLIGYESRALRREDFGNDAVDAGEIGAGHGVTALYELVPAGSAASRIEPLRYAAPQDSAAPPASGAELAFVKLRYKAPAGGASQLISQPVLRAAQRPSLDAASESMRFAVAVAAFGQRLTGGRQLEGWGYDRIAALARGARGDDPHGDRAELLKLIDLASALTPTTLAAHERQPSRGTD